MGTERIILEWKYEPPDFFEAPCTIEIQDYNISINNGIATAIISPEFYDSREDLRNEFHEKIIDRFLGVQCINFKKFNITKPTIMHRLYSDGRKDITIFSEPFEVRVTMSASFETMITDKNGNILTDTKSEKIKLESHIAKLSAKYRRYDPVANSILKSFNAAVNDPDNEFVYLYEIIESLSGRFENEKGLRDALGVSKTYIGKLRKLANAEPVTQGRHRGKSPGQLRTATITEKMEAREIAGKLIQLYLEHLDQNT